MVSTGAVGAALMYFLDPDRGRKRRARVVEAAMHARRLESNFLGKAWRDAAHRAQGLVHPRDARAVEDSVLIERIRSCLGRAVSHAGAIGIAAGDGRVALSGPILEREAEAALRAVRAVPGVRDVSDALARHATEKSSPELSGTARRRRGVAWAPALRAAAIAAGGAIALTGLVRGGLGGLAACAAGVALATRATTNRPLSRTGEIRLQKAVTIRAPIERVYELWSQLDVFPRFMDHVREVHSDGDRSEWVLDAIPGHPVKFEAEITHRVPNRSISWRTVPNQTIEHEGTVHFTQTDRGTRVQIDMRYRPPGGLLGHGIARLFGWDPRHMMNSDFVRVKELLEIGRTRAHHRRVDLAELLAV